MKKTGITFFSGVLLVILLASCVSFKDREINVRDRAGVRVVDQATVKFHSWQLFNIPSSRRIKNAAYNKLKNIAQEKHGANVDVANIVITGSVTPLELVHIGPATVLAAIGVATAIAQEQPFNLTISGAGILVAIGIGNWQRITATGDVVLYE